MHKALVILVIFLGIARFGSAGSLKRFDQRTQSRIDAEYQRQENEENYIVVNGLTSIAQGSASRAHNAVANQYAAAQQAAYLAQNTLAQEANHAAATARAALAGKEYAYSGLERQVTDARNSLEAEFKQYQISERAATAAKEAADAAIEQVSSLTTTLTNANDAAEKAKIAADEAADELASQTSMVTKAQEVLRAASAKLRAAQIDYEATKEAAEKAAAAAITAQENAASARAYAAQKLHSSSWNSPSESRIRSESSSSSLFGHRA